jgi:hypothetical protein
MDIDAATPWSAQVFARQNATVGHNDSHLCLVGRKKILSLVDLDLARLFDMQAVLQSELFDWRRLNLFPTARRPIGLGPYGDDLMSVLEQTLQRRHRRPGRSHENYAHETGGFAALRAVRLRLTGQQLINERRLRLRTEA